MKLSVTLSHAQWNMGEVVSSAVRLDAGDFSCIINGTKMAENYKVILILMICMGLIVLKMNTVSLNVQKIVMYKILESFFPGDFMSVPVHVKS